MRVAQEGDRHANRLTPRAGGIPTRRAILHDIINRRKQRGRRAVREIYNRERIQVGELSYKTYLILSIIRLNSANPRWSTSTRGY